MIANDEPEPAALIHRLVEVAHAPALDAVDLRDPQAVLADDARRRRRVRVGTAPDGEREQREGGEAHLVPYHGAPPPARRRAG